MATDMNGHIAVHIIGTVVSVHEPGSTAATRYHLDNIIAGLDMALALRASGAVVTVVIGPTNLRWFLERVLVKAALFGAPHYEPKVEPELDERLASLRAAEAEVVLYADAPLSLLAGVRYVTPMQAGQIFLQAAKIISF